MYQWHMEVVAEGVWVARLYWSLDKTAQECFDADKEYLASATVVLHCLGTAEVKGLDKPINAAAFRAAQKALHEIGIDTMEVRRHGKVRFYEWRSFTQSGS